MSATQGKGVTPTTESGSTGDIHLDVDGIQKQEADKVPLAEASSEVLGEEQDKKKELTAEELEEEEKKKKAAEGQTFGNYLVCILTILSRVPLKLTPDSEDSRPWKSS